MRNLTSSLLSATDMDFPIVDQYEGFSWKVLQPKYTGASNPDEGMLELLICAFIVWKDALNELSVHIINREFTQI